MKSTVQKIAVLGGGIAGHMAAAHLVRHRPAAHLFHIYDPAIPAIGVGEGTLPAFRHWIHEITGLSPADLRARCAMTPKKGIRFEMWGQRQTHFYHYFAGASTAYHLSAASLCPLLADYFTAERMSDQVVALNSNGREVDVLLQNGGRLSFDFVFDARGFPKTLTADHLPLSIIPTNAALIRRGPVTAFQGATRAVARPHGWIFVIPLATDTAYGYIYNEQIGDASAATADFDHFLVQEEVPPGPTRALRFPNFRRQTVFDGALFKIGNAASFMEPLEATAIGLILLQLEAAVHWLDGSSSPTAPLEERSPAAIRTINEELASTVDAVSLFVGWHYSRGSAYDTPFWRFAQENFKRQLARVQDKSVGQTFLRLIQAGQSFPADRLHLVPNPLAYESTIDPLLTLAESYAGFDELSFAQVGFGLGYFTAGTVGPSPTGRPQLWKDNMSASPPIQPVSPTALRQAQNILEEALLEAPRLSGQELVNQIPWPALSDLLPADHLDLLFQIELGLLIKRGPGGVTSLTPRSLLAIAQAAAKNGYLPLAAPIAFRRRLAALTTDLRRVGAWRMDRPLWWEPLPKHAPLEEYWQSFQSEWLSRPDPEELGRVLSNTPAAPLWLALPALLAPESTRLIHDALETAYQAGRLPLERGGVGVGDNRSARRTDWVRYITGQEADLLANNPALAALAQWSLAFWADYLAETTGRPLFPPQQAMLARYPAGGGGFTPHLDNPGGEQDNGRTLTLVMYLNQLGAECSGGEIALWDREAPLDGPPAAVLSPRSGSAVLFDSRQIAHQVRPLAAGPARWALSLWLNDVPQKAPAPPQPTITLSDVLRPIADPPLPPDSILFHDLSADNTAGEILVHSLDSATPQTKPRVGVVCTVFRGGSRLDDWCAHHFSLGFAHILLIFDHLEDPAEMADAQRLRAAYPEDRLTIWSGDDVAWGRWPALPALEEKAALLRTAGLGDSSQAVAARQMLNAGVALQAARTAELGGLPLDWLLHLDSDELFYLLGAGRGGTTLEDHFTAAAAANWRLLHYANHELLAGPPDQPTRFKVNPRLAAARLGPLGWERFIHHLRLAPTDPRPYFNGYTNGKAAVFVPAAQDAAGVHSWLLAEPDATGERFLAGPVILHFRYASAVAFRQKYLAVAAAPVPPADRLFSPSPAEEQILARIEELHRAGAGQEQLSDQLDELRRSLTHFSEPEVALLEAAGLIFQPHPEIKYPI